MSAPTVKPSPASSLVGAKAPRAGLFIGSWTIDARQPGAPTVALHCTFDASSGAVQGLAHLIQAVSPPLDVSSRSEGDFTYLSVMPDSSRVLVTLTGYPVLQWRTHGGVGPAQLPNLHVRMLLDADWQRGAATVRYLSSTGGWLQVESAPVQVASDVTMAGRP
ncbi:DUF1842 domain-containing protein [Pilimelia columellifera]|uniref:DUF1842 domain-containing protein n=1 Tax=Pilimelia columellifera subsp. columellifera TaxID=706583 RepID=A0ABP6A8V1_9ACTN